MGVIPLFYGLDWIVYYDILVVSRALVGQLWSLHTKSTSSFKFQPSIVHCKVLAKSCCVCGWRAKHFQTTVNIVEASLLRLVDN